MPTPDNIPEFVQLLARVPEAGLFLWLRIILTIVSVVMVALIIWLLAVSNWLEEHGIKQLFNFVSFRRIRLARPRVRLRRIRGRLESDREEDWKLALIEAEEFLDSFLERRGIAGDSAAEKVRAVAEEALKPEETEEFLQASQLTDNIIHDPEYSVDQQEARRALDCYESVLQRLTSL